MQQSIISIDPSLRSTGITLLTFDSDDNQFDLTLKTLKSVKDDERMQVFSDQFRTVHTLCKDNNVVFGVVEGYSFGSQGNVFTQTVEAGCACRLGISVQGIPLVELPPPKWKNTVLSNGNLSKKQIREKVAEILQPNRKPKNVVSRLFFGNLPKSWTSPDELDSLLVLIAFFIILVKAPDYFHSQVRAEKVLADLRTAMIDSLKVNNLLSKRMIQALSTLEK